MAGATFAVIIMRKRSVILIAAALLLTALAVVVNRRSDSADFHVPALTAAELEQFTPVLEADLRLLEELRRQVGTEPDAWQSLPEAGRTLYVTLWAEEVHRTVTWGRVAIMGTQRLGPPTLDEVAAGYAALELPQTVSAVRGLGQRFRELQDAARARSEHAQASPQAPFPTTDAVEGAAHATFAHLDAVRAKRLEFARANAADLGLP